jgi:hypothetical protein
MKKTYDEEIGTYFSVQMGKLYQFRKDHLEKMEIKNVNGDWYHRESSSGEWLEMDWEDEY